MNRIINRIINSIIALALVLGGFGVANSGNISQPIQPLQLGQQVGSNYLAYHGCYNWRLQKIPCHKYTGKFRDGYGYAHRHCWYTKHDHHWHRHCRWAR